MKCITAILVIFLCYKYGQGYKATVFEHFPFTNESSAEHTILENQETYRRNIAKAQDQNVNIIVFPEYGLTGLNPEPLEDYAIDITANTYRVIERFSDMAIEHKMYIVVNLLEKEKTENRKTKYYNTNLVFARNGSMIAKYRKINLYNEDKLTPGTEPVTFSTDFGVTFGLLTSFDMLFYNPSRTIFNENEGVTDVVCPAAWKSITPFYSSLTIQHGYAVSNAVNLLTAGYDQPKKGYGGSSIILADGKIREAYIDITTSSKPVTQELVTNSLRKIPNECSSLSAKGLPIDPSQKPTIADFVTGKLFRASDYHFKNIDLTQNEITEEVCYKKFCCTFTIKISEKNVDETYKLMAYDGKETLGDVERLIRVCSLVSCDSDDKNSCGARINGTTKFTSIKVEGTFKKNNETFYMPITLNYDLKPIQDISYCERSNDSNVFVQLNTRRFQQEVLTFGLYGVYDVSASSAIQISTMLLFVFSIVTRMFL